jgi:hypothetical protein
MQLNPSDGVSVELRIAGYDFPEPGMVADRWDANWLRVCGHIALADGRAWAFEHACLTTWEARELGDWLREVAAGTEPAFHGYFEPQGQLGFTEPNLGFTLEERTAGRLRITAELTTEARPPWFRHGPDHAPNSYLVCLDLSAEAIAQAAESWMHELAEFPER